MDGSPRFDADVTIVGLGPVGMAVAGLLGRRGIRVLGIDRDRDVFPQPRAAHIDHQGLRLLQELGCLDGVLPRMIANSGLDFLDAAGDVLCRIPGDQPSVSGLPASMYFHQPHFDRQIRATVVAMPTVDVLLGHEMRSLSTFPDHVMVKVRGEHGEQHEIRTRWLVGCDGAGSRVRELAELPLQDLHFHETWVVVDLLLKRSIDLLPDRALNVCDPVRPITAIPIPDGRFRFEVMVLPGETGEELERPENVLPLLARWVPSGATEVERSAVYTFHGLLAERWRAGRTLIAGDAAHQMPPFLGQGMNSGLRDAANLAWKLALVAQGRASERLLDTYDGERRPHVEEIIRAAIKYGRMTCTLDPNEAAERDRQMHSDPRPLTQRLPFRLPSLATGPLVRDGGGGLFPQAVTNGSSVRLDDVVGPRFFVLGRTHEALGESAGWWSQKMGAFVATVGDLAEEFPELKLWLDRRSADVAVVRPDRYVLAAALELDAVTREVAPFLIGGIGAESAPLPRS